MPAPPTKGDLCEGLKSLLSLGCAVASSCGLLMWPLHVCGPCSCAGTDLAQALTTKDSIAAKKAAMPADVAKALGRLSSGLYVVTAAHNNARSAMIASWVSQVRACGVGACRLVRPGWSGRVG